MFHAVPCAASGTPLPVKVNLYRGMEVDALADALAADPLLARSVRVDCVMVSDSVLMTHYGRSSTRLAPAEQALFLSVMVEMVREVARHVRDAFPIAMRPAVVGDMPDGAASTIDKAHDAAQAMIAAGADVVKLEVHEERTFETIASLVGDGVRVMAHLGYTPQAGDEGRVGGSAAAAKALLAKVDAARDAGAESIVLEKVDPLLHAMIADRHDALPVYAIFSGRSRKGGQSLNVWDAVFKPGFDARYFPPTARYEVVERNSVYDRPTIAGAIRDLLRLAAEGLFPKDPPSKMQPGMFDRLMDQGG